MALTLAEIAARLGVGLQGDGAVTVHGVATLRNAGPGDLSFLANPRYRKHLAGTRASAVILSPEDAGQCPVPALISDNPYACYARAARLLAPPPRRRRGIDPSAVVDPSARIDESAWIGPQCVVEANARVDADAQIGPASVIGRDVHVGEASELLARVTLMHGVRIGRRVVIQPGAVIGGDGFGLANVGGQWQRVPQLGAVRIGDDVDIGANTTVDRGALDDTVIEEGVKIDNQVQVGHNVFIGAHTAIAGCVGISGSARIGRYCTLAGGVGIVGHLEIADHVHITGMSMVTRSITEAGTYSAGTPLMPNRSWRRNAVRMRSLDELAGRIDKLEKTCKTKD